MTDAGLQKTVDGVSPSTELINRQQVDQRLKKWFILKQPDGFGAMSGMVGPSFRDCAARPAFCLEATVGLAEIMQKDEDR